MPGNNRAPLYEIRSFFDRHIRAQNWLPILVLALLTGLLAYPIYHFRIHTPVDTDYGSHIRFAAEFLKTRTLNKEIISHPVLHFMLAFLYWLTRSRLDLYNALLIIQIAVQISIALILYFWIGPSTKHKNWDWLRAAVSVTFTFLGPVMLLAFSDHQFYFGYIGLSNYHNPTIHLLKPLALLSLILAVRCLDGKKSGWGTVFLSALLLSLSAWVKPSYALAVLPGLTLAALLRVLQKQKPDWRLFWLGFVLPGVMNLGLQYYIAYAGGLTGSGFILAPFQVEKSFSDWLLLKFILSCLFPLVVLWLARARLLTDSTLLAGWTVFLTGIAQNYLLAEAGARFGHGNFRWSGQIGLFLLFAAAVRWLLHQRKTQDTPGKTAHLGAWIAYAAHLLGGIAYYIYCLVSVHYG